MDWLATVTTWPPQNSAIGRARETNRGAAQVTREARERLHRSRNGPARGGISSHAPDGHVVFFRAGPLDQLTTVFERNPYDFDDQRLELLDLKLNAGDVTRVTCNYQNTTDQTITFGESTHNEMCFLVGFAADRESTSGCLVGDFPGPRE
jgi:hypothetical protein